MAEARSALAVALLVAGALIALVGLGFVELPGGTGPGGGTTTTTTSATLLARLRILATDNTGQPLPAKIYVNGELVSTNGVADLEKPVGGVYRVTWGDMPNYVTPPPQDVLLTLGEVTEVRGVYVPSGSQTYRLTVKVRVCSATFNVCMWVMGAEVTVRPVQQSGATYRGETDENGVVVFNVASGTYQIDVSSVYGDMGRQVTVNQNREELFSYATGGLSILPSILDSNILSIAVFLAIAAMVYLMMRRRR